MLQGSPTHELDRIIAKAQDAQTQLRDLIEGITPDDNGVVTSTVEAAATHATEFRAEVASLTEIGLAVASVIDDLHPQTSGTFDQMTVLSDRLVGRLGRSSVGHADGDLASIASEDPATVAASTESTDDETPGASYYGV